MNLVKDYMTKDIVAVGDVSTIRRVIQVMKRQRMCAVPVVNKKGEYLGCISESDILGFAMPNYMKMITNTSFLANLDIVTVYLGKILDRAAKELMDTKYPVVTPDDSLSFAADLLFRSKRTVIPVVHDKILIGLFSRLDFLSVSLENGNDNLK